MEKILIFFSLLFFNALNADVKSLEQEINHLERQKQLLQLELKSESHQEVNQEVQSQKDIKCIIKDVKCIIKVNFIKKPNAPGLFTPF